MGLVADDTRGMTVPTGIVGEHDITGFKDSLYAIARFDFPGTRKCHEELATRRRVAIQKESRRGGTKNGACSRTRVTG
jgi:hypothetical protein